MGRKTLLRRNISVGKSRANGPVSQFLESYAIGMPTGGATKGSATGPVDGFIDGPARFHMPGHKGRGKALVHAAAWDITEIPGADNLLSPEGLLKTAQEEAAAFFGAAASYFLPGGSSQGMQAAILALPANTIVYASRDCHRSLISALALSGHRARFLPPVPAADGRNALPTVDSLEAAFAEILSKGENAGVPFEKEAQDGSGIPSPAGGATPLALVITRPDYFGRCCDIAVISDFCRRAGIVLVVDEAHGAHFPLSDRLPDSAIPYADVIFASAHKTLDAPNPAAYLHLGRTRSPHAPTADALERAARLLGTTSPPYPLLAALDQAWRGQRELWERHIDRLDAWRKTLPPRWQGALERGQFGRVDQENRAASGDLTRLCFDVRPTGTGHALEAHLRRQGVFMEMADSFRVVGITSPLDPPEWYDRLRAGLESYNSAVVGDRVRWDALGADAAQGREARDGAASATVLSMALSPGGPLNLPSPPLPEQVCTVRQALLAPLERVSEEEAAGRVCARSVGAYPPGSALICPGERIDQAMVKHLQALRDGGATLFGLPFLCIKEEV